MPSAEPTPTTDRLLSLIDRFAGHQVVVAADLVVDRFITGTPKRISREAPVLILRHEEERLAPGGGANAVANVAALGGRPLPLGVVGDDPSGQALLAELDRLGVPTDGIRVRSGYRTPTKTRVLGGGRGAVKQQIVRFDVEDTLSLDEDDRAHFRAALEGWAGAGVAILSDYGYGTAEGALVAELRGRGRGGPGGASGSGSERTVLLDSRHRLGELPGADGATPNEEEAEELYGGPLEPGGAPGAAGSPEEARRAVHHAAGVLLERLGVRFLLVTRGSRGMVLALPGRSAHLPVHGTAQVADVTGAGDTVIGTFALATAAGASPLEAALLADYAGGVVVMKTGTATLTPAELTEAVRSDPGPLEELAWVAS